MMGCLDVREQVHLLGTLGIALAGIIGIWCTTPSPDMILVAQLSLFPWVIVFLSRLLPQGSPS